MNVKKNPFRVLWLILGCIMLTVGTVGIIIPVLPTFPFYAITVFSFAKSSKRMHDWFVNTGLYKKHMKTLIRSRKMTRKTKAYVITMVTLVMGFGFVLMEAVPIARVILAFIWISHVLYFIFRIGTISEKERDEIINAE